MLSTMQSSMQLDIKELAPNPLCREFGHRDGEGRTLGDHRDCVIHRRADWGTDFSKLSIVVLAAVILMLVFVKPKHELTYPEEEIKKV